MHHASIGIDNPGEHRQFCQQIRQHGRVWRPGRCGWHRRRWRGPCGLWRGARQRRRRRRGPWQWHLGKFSHCDQGLPARYRGPGGDQTGNRGDGRWRWGLRQRHGFRGLRHRLGRRGLRHRLGGRNGSGNRRNGHANGRAHGQDTDRIAGARVPNLDAHGDRIGVRLRDRTHRCRRGAFARGLGQIERIGRVHHDKIGKLPPDAVLSERAQYRRSRGIDLERGRRRRPSSAPRRSGRPSARHVASNRRRHLPPVRCVCAIAAAEPGGLPPTRRHSLSTKAAPAR